jgi:TPR repeat protein
MKILAVLLILFQCLNAYGQSKSKKTGDDLYQEYLYKCGTGDGDACFTIGNYFYMNKNVTKEEQKSGILYLDAGCKLDNADACRAAGMSTYFGEFQQQKNITKGLEYLKKGCDFNDGYSCTFFAIGSYDNGLLNLKLYKKYLSKGCKLGDKVACSELKKIKE